MALLLFLLTFKDKMEVGRYKKACRGEKLQKLFGGCPRQYVDILRSIDKTKFFDEPEYQFIYKQLRDALKSTNSKVLMFNIRVIGQ